MFRGGLLFRFLIAVLIVGILIGGGFALYRAGLAQGYQAGLVAVQNGNQPASPISPNNGGFPGLYYGRGYGFGYPGFFAPFGIFFGIGFLFLIFFLIGGIFRFGGWGHRGYYGSGYGPGPYPPNRDRHVTDVGSERKSEDPNTDR